MPSYTDGQEGGIKTWLRQVGVRLKLAGVTGEQDRYEHVIASLPTEILSRVYDLVNDQPETDPYTTLVKRIQTEFEPTDSEQVKKLLEGMKIGDAKPTLFLRSMRALAKGRVTDVVLKELFLKQLPGNLRKILSVVETPNLESLAAAADRGVQSDCFSGVAEIQKSHRDEPSAVQKETQSMSAMEQKFDEMMGKMVEAMERLAQNHPTRRPRSQTPGREGGKNHRQRSNSKRRNPNWKLCYAHHRFGDKARTCEHWCERWGTKPENSEN